MPVNALSDVIVATCMFCTIKLLIECTGMYGSNHFGSEGENKNKFGRKPSQAWTYRQISS
jgi:hypothetical protein